MGLLYGLDPAPVERCRVLDIGCNEAGNIIPMAYAMPDSEFVGFDLATLPIAQAQQRIDELGLRNIRVFQANLTDVGDSLGTFDYIIAHGVYAWVPDHVRDHLLAFCRRHLAPQGIAFISYNALPGGHIRNLVRDILLQSGQRDDDPERNVDHAVQFLRFTTQARPQGDPIRSLLEKEVKQIERKGSRVVYHDEMADHQRPVSFSSFVAHAAQHGLQYLSDSVLPPPGDPCYQPEIAATAQALSGGDFIVQEQILDYARMRMYRQTLLCHAECVVDREVRLEALDRLQVSSQAQSSLGTKQGSHTYKLPGGIQMESEHLPTIAIMEELIAVWPQSLSIAETGEMLQRKGIAFDADVLILLLRLVVARMVVLGTWKAPVDSTIAERPLASAASRQEAVIHERASTLLHTVLGLSDPIVRKLLLLLDGTRDHAALLQALRLAFPDMPEATLTEGLEPSLLLLHESGVLLAEGASLEQQRRRS